MQQGESSDEKEEMCLNFQVLELLSAQRAGQKEAWIVQTSIANMTAGIMAILSVVKEKVEALTLRAAVATFERLEAVAGA